RRQRRHSHAPARRHRRSGDRPHRAGGWRHRRAVQLRRYRAHGSILDASVKDWDQAFSVNVRSMFLVSKAFLPGMLKKQKGSIINYLASDESQFASGNVFSIDGGMTI